jgi:hypothetical protein
LALVALQQYERNGAHWKLEIHVENFLQPDILVCRRDLCRPVMQLNMLSFEFKVPTRCLHGTSYLGIYHFVTIWANAALQ